MAQQKNYYTILEIPKTASDEEIKSAYRRLSLLYHPDRNPESNDNQFKEISEAYAILSDPNKRRTYDLKSDFITTRGPQEQRAYRYFRRLFGGEQ